MCLDKSEKVFVAMTYVSEGAENGVGDKAGEVGWMCCLQPWLSPQAVWLCSEGFRNINSQVDKNDYLDRKAI